jgi:GTPase SAR1 family protein
MKIDIKKAGSQIKLFKSTRDRKFPSLKFEDGSNGLPSESFTMILNGAPGSGKSLFVENIIRNFYNTTGKHTVWSYIAYFCPTSSQDSYENSFAEDLDTDDIYDELNTTTLGEAYDKAAETSAEGTKKKPKFSLIIIDDFASELRTTHGKDGGVKKLLLKMLRNFRHVSLTILISVQGYLSLDPQHRNVIRNLVQFKTGSFPEIEKIWLEWGAGMDKNTFVNEFFPFIFDKKYNFLQIDRFREFAMCKSFNPITIHKTDDEENENENDLNGKQ